MNKPLVVGDGTHYEKAHAWVTATPGDTIKMPDGQLLKLLAKNPKSAACENNQGESVTVPLKKLLPNGSDAYVRMVVRALQDELQSAAGDTRTFLEEETLPQYGCEIISPLARRIIRACTYSTNPKVDVLGYLDNRLSKEDKKLSVLQQQAAARIALRHLLGDFPCPMHDDKEYARAEWKAFDTWFFHHNKTKLLIDAAEKFDELIKRRIGDTLYGSIFKRYSAKSATHMACGLKDCLHSWFQYGKTTTLEDMFEAYEHLMCRIDSQSDRMTFILNNRDLFSPERDPQELTALLLESPAKDLLEPILV